MKTPSARPLVFAVLTGSLLLTGCMSHYGPNGPGRGGEGMGRSMDWETRHMEAHRHMMPYHYDYAYGMDGRGMSPGSGPGMGAGPGSGPGTGPGAGRGTGPGMGAMSMEQRRAAMAAHLKVMPPEVVKRRMEIMEMEMQMMREHMASQPAKK